MFTLSYGRCLIIYMDAHTYHTLHVQAFLWEMFDNLDACSYISYTKEFKLSSGRRLIIWMDAHTYHTLNVLAFLREMFDSLDVCSYIS